MDADALSHADTYAHVNANKYAFPDPNTDGDAVSLTDAYNHGHTNPGAAAGDPYRHADAYGYAEDRCDCGDFSNRPIG